MKLHSDSFEEESVLPVRYTAAGENVSPPFRWDGAPDETRSFALIMEEIAEVAAPHGPKTHWLVYDISGDLKGVLQGKFGLAKTGRNDFNATEYTGPCPAGGCTTALCFTLYALDVESLGLREGAPREQVQGAMAGHVLAEARLMCHFAAPETAGAGASS